VGRADLPAAQERGPVERLSKADHVGTFVN
jgi:hypothetical protein